MENLETETKNRSSLFSTIFLVKRELEEEKLSFFRFWSIFLNMNFYLLLSAFHKERENIVPFFILQEGSTHTSYIFFLIFKIKNTSVRKKRKSMTQCIFLFCYVQKECGAVWGRTPFFIIIIIILFNFSTQKQYFSQRVREREREGIMKKKIKRKTHPAKS